MRWVLSISCVIIFGDIMVGTCYLRKMDRIDVINRGGPRRGFRYVRSVWVYIHYLRCIMGECLTPRCRYIYTDSTIRRTS